MEEQELLLSNTKKFLRSALISSKGGLPAEQVYRDYRDLVGEGIPYRRLGYETLDSFLSATPDVCRISRRPTGEVVVVGVADDATRHIQELVNRQNSKSKKSKAKPKRPARRPLQQSTNWNAPPVQQQQQQPLKPGGSGRFPLQQRGGGGRGGGGGFRGGGRAQPLPRGGGSRGGGGRQGGVPLREPRFQQQQQQQGGGLQGVGRGTGGQGGGRGGQGAVKSPPRGQQQSRPPPAKTNFKGDLQTYFTASNLGDVPYKIATMGMKGKEKYMATVTVEGEQFKTYPQTYNSQVEAEEALAEVIVKKLGILSGQGGGGGVGETSDPRVYADRVVELIGDRQNGMWSAGVEEQYLERWGEKLPSLWFQEVEAEGRIRVDCPIPGSGRYIVFPMNSGTYAPRSEGTPEAVFNQQQPAALPFPEDDLWDVFITCVRSTTHLSIRLVGDDTSERFEDLSSNMDLHYYDKGAIPQVAGPEVGKIYAAHLSSDWHRVKVVEVRGLACTCWFIDHGDTEVVPLEDLRELAPKFLSLPPQAVTVQLAGLEDYEYSAAVLDHLNTLLLGKSLVAKVENRRLLGGHNTRNGKSLPRLVLFDTSSEDVDVNLNQKLIELLVSQDSQSKLPQPGGEEVSVLVSHIDKNGDIYVQKESSAFTMVEKLIVEHSEEVLASAPASLLLPDSLYLVKYSEDGSLYRAALLPDPAVKDSVGVFFVDYGNSSAVALSDVWELSSLPESLVQELPRQALRCKLDGAPPPGHYWSEQATRALRDLVPESQSVRLKVTAISGDCPLVEINLPESKDGSVNFDLSTELDLFPLSPSSQPPSPARNGDTVNGTGLVSPPPPVTNGSNPEASGGQDLASLKTLASPTIPSEGQYFDVSVTFAVSPSNFVVQPYNEVSVLVCVLYLTSSSRVTSWSS